MKTRYILLALGLAAVAAGCQKNFDDQSAQTPVGKTETITIRAVKSVDTKTEFWEDEENVYHTAWEAGDRISVYEFVVGKTDAPELYDLDGECGPIESDPLSEGGEVASFSVTMDSYYWDTTMTEEELATYDFKYRYLATTYPYYAWYMMEDYETGERYIPLWLFPDQYIGPGRFSTESDILVSELTEPFSKRPEEIEFHFARLGTIVRITITGLQAGDILRNGTWYTGDTFLPALNLESVISYYPERGQYKYEIPDYLHLEDLEGCHQVNFFVDDEDPIVAGADGSADIYLRCLPGTLSDWFMLLCNLERGGEEVICSKFVSLDEMNRSLTFKDSGLTKFSVEVKEACVHNPEEITYMITDSRTGFVAAWDAQEHVSKYECYLKTYDYDEGRYHRTELTPFDGNTIGLDGKVCVKPTGLEPAYYTLEVRALPDSEHGSFSADFHETEIPVGIPVSTRWSSDSYTVEDDGLWYYDGWCFCPNNVTTDRDSYALYCTGDWSFGTSVDPDRQHQGQLAEVTLVLNKSNVNDVTVFGMDADGRLTEITTAPEEIDRGSQSYYTYDLESAGVFNGFRICGSTSLIMYQLHMAYYEPEFYF